MELTATIKNGKLKLYRPDKWQEEINKYEGKEVLFTIKKVKGQRTINQNSALHMFFYLLAEEMNTAGLTQSKVLAESIAVDWEMESVKNLIWRPLQQALLNKKSTTELNKTEDITKVYEHLVRFFADNFKFQVMPFPSQDMEY